MRSRTTKIFVHIGPPKTATTFIQDTLWGNKAALDQQGIHLVGRRAFDHYLAAMDLRGRTVGDYPDPRIVGAWKRLVGAAERVGSGKAVISHEYLAGLRAPKVAQLVADLGGVENLHVIFTARDLGRQLPAVWQEGLKNRQTLSFDDFLEGLLGPHAAKRREKAFWRAHDPLIVLKRWAAALPPDQIHVLTAPGIAAKNVDLWSRFASVLGVDSSRLDLTVSRRNASLSRADAEVLRMVNGRFPAELDWPTYQRLIKSRMGYLANQQSRGERILVPQRYRTRVLEEAARTKKGLAEAGYDLIGDLSDLDVADEEFGPDDPVPPEQVADAATALLAEVMTKPVMRGGIPTSETPAQRRRRQVSDRIHAATAKVRRIVPRRSS